MTENPLPPPRPTLPPASLLAQFKAFDANAPEWILAKAESIGVERRARELREVRKGFLRKDFWLAVLQGMAMAFDPLPRPTPVAINSRDGAPIEADWRALGNDLRAAMKAYVAEHRFDLDRLTEAERRELQPVRASEGAPPHP